MRRNCGLEIPDRVYDLLNANREGDAWIAAIFEDFLHGRAPLARWLLFRCIEAQLYDPSDRRRFYTHFAKAVERKGGTVGMVAAPDDKFYQQFVLEDFERVGIPVREGSE